MIFYCEDCRVDFFAFDCGDGQGFVGVDVTDAPHLDHEWSNPNWYDDGR